MKKFILFLALGVALVSCKDDEPKNNESQAVVGTWIETAYKVADAVTESNTPAANEAARALLESTCRYYNDQYQPNLDKWVMKADGTMQGFYFSKNQWKEWEETKDKVIKWSISNNILTLVIGDEVSKFDCKVTDNNLYIYHKAIDFTDKKMNYYPEGIPEGLSALKSFRDVRVYTKQ